MNEDDLTARLMHALPVASGIGIGDDAAFVRIGAQDVVVAKDVLIDGSHFALAECGLHAALYKAVAVNLSDLAAVAATPDAFLVGVVLPTAHAPRLADEWTDALARVVDSFGVPCVGGDTNVADAPLTLSVTVLGHVGAGGFVARTGAKVGDILSVTGPLGGSRAGRHLRPVPRLGEAAVLAEMRLAHAMIDLSDGLATDVPRLCRASDIGATIEGALVPVHGDVAAVAVRERLEVALTDGEDFELLVAHPALDDMQRAVLAKQNVTLHSIGVCAPLDDGMQLLWEGRREPLPTGGFDHFMAR